MLGPFTTASRLTPIHQMSLAVLSRAACASMSTTTPTTTTTRDRGEALVVLVQYSYCQRLFSVCGRSLKNRSLYYSRVYNGKKSGNKNVHFYRRNRHVCQRQEIRNRHVKENTVAVPCMATVSISECVG